MKKVFLSLCLFLFVSIQVLGADLCSIKYKNISNRTKISYDLETSKWSKQINTKNDSYFIKTKGFGEYYDYLTSNKEFAFTTDCEYDFIDKGRFIGYSNSDFLFFEFDYIDGKLIRTPVAPDDVQALFPEYKLIKLSEFSAITNSLKIKKGFGDLKVIIYNDLKLDMRDFNFTTGNSDFDKYQLSGFINIKKKGMIQLAKDNDSMKSSTWFILLVR